MSFEATFTKNTFAAKSFDDTVLPKLLVAATTRAQEELFVVKRNGSSRTKITGLFCIKSYLSRLTAGALVAFHSIKYARVDEVLGIVAYNSFKV